MEDSLDQNAEQNQDSLSNHQESTQQIETSDLPASAPISVAEIEAEKSRKYIYIVLITKIH